MYMFCHSFRSNREMCDLNDANVSVDLIACGSSFYKVGSATYNARLPYVSNPVLSTVNSAWEAERRVRDG